MLKRVLIWVFLQAEVSTHTCSDMGGWENESLGSLLFLALQDAPFLRLQGCVGRWVSAPTSHAIGLAPSSPPLSPFACSHNGC